jgi:hypothetical protein
MALGQHAQQKPCLSGARVRTYLSWAEILFELLLFPIFAVLRFEIRSSERLAYRRYMYGLRRLFVAVSMVTR